MPVLRLRPVRIAAAACLALGLAIPASAGAAAGPPYSDGSIPDAIETCAGAPYDIVERDGDLYVRCSGPVTDDWRVFTTSASVSATTATITISRAHARGRALVAYETQAGTAVPTIDYLATSGRVYFADHQTTATVTVPLPAAGPLPGSPVRSFTVSFGDPVALGLTVPTATVELPATAPAPPAPTVESGPSTTTPLRRGTFTFSGEPDATLECRVDAQAFAGCLSPQTVSNLAVGGHRFEVRQRVDGVTSAAASYDWTIAGAPDPGYPAGPPYSGGRLDADYACDGGLYDIHVVQGTRFVRCLAGGGHGWQRFSATATVSGSTATVTLTRDDAEGAPALVEFRTAPGSAVAGVDYTALEGELFFAPGVTQRTLQIPVLRDPDATGPRQFELALSDPAGSSLSLSDVTVTIPGPPDAPSITSGPSGEQIVHTASFGFTGAAGASFECRIDDAAFAPCTSPRALTRVPAGERRFEVRQRDGVSGPWSAPAARTWTVLPSPDPGYPDGPPYATTTRPIDADYFCDGGFYSLPTHNGDKYLWCLGSNGNKPWQQLSTDVELGEDTATVTISRAAGQVPIVLGFATEAGTATAGRDFTAAAGELYFAENVTSRTLTIPIVRDPDAGEPRSFSLRLAQPVQQGLGTLPAIDVTIPGNPPTASVAPTVSGTPRVGHQLTSTDGEWTHQPTSVVRRWERCDADGDDCVAIDGADEAAYAPTAADVGARLRITVTATNGSGALSGSSSPSAVVRAALAAPQIASGPTGTQILHRAQVAFTGESGATFECRLGDAAFAPCTSPRTLTELPAGAQRFEVRQTATDGVVSDPAVREWTVLPGPDPEYPLAPPYGHVSDPDEACDGGAYQLLTYNGDRYTACLGARGQHGWQRFAATATVASETATVTVTRESGREAALLAIETENGTAVAGRDYETRSGELYFARNVTSRTVEIPVARDPDATSDRAFTLALRDVVDANLRVEDATVTIPGRVVPPDPGGEPGPGDGGGPDPGNGGEPGPGEQPGAGDGAGTEPPTVVPPIGGGTPQVPPGAPATPGAPPRNPVRMTTIGMELRFCAGCTRPSAADRRRLQRLRARVAGSRLLAIDGYGDRGRSRSDNRRLARSRVRAVERVLLSGLKRRPARRTVVAHDRLVRAGTKVAADVRRGGRSAERIVTVRVVNRR